MTIRALTFVAAVGFVTALPAVAYAAESDASDTESMDARKPDVWAHVVRPWLYAPDPSAPPAGHVVAALGVGYAQVDRGAARPFAGDVTHAGAVLGADVEVGLSRFVSVVGQGLLSGESTTSTTGETINGGGMLGVSLTPLPASFPVGLAIAAGYLRELGGGNGLWGRASIAGDVGRLRLTGTVLTEHIFASHRDAIDILLSAGASYRVQSWLRLGVEYVVQDLEGAWEEDEDDGGIRHFLGPSMVLNLSPRVQIAGGPAFGLSSGAPAVLGRMAASYYF